MPGLLQRKAHPAREDPPEDVENPGRRRSFAPGGHDPILLAKTIFRKVVAGLTDGGDGNDESQGIIGFLGEVIVGIVMGILCIAALVFLDYRDVIHLDSTHNFRQGVGQLLSDPATLASIEEAAGIKLLTPEKHGAMESEMSDLAKKKEELGAKVREMEAAEAKSKELADAGVPEEYKELGSNPLLELGRYCDGCPWRDGKTCAERAAEAAAADGAGRVASKLKVMAEEAILWEKKEAGATCSFPPGCRWDCYLEIYADLKKAFGDSEQKALQHWTRHGFKEGRNCKCKGS